MKDRVEFPDVAELHLIRRERIGMMMSLRHRNLDHANELLKRDQGTFSLLTMLETSREAQEHLSEWKGAFERLMQRLKDEDHSQAVIDHVTKFLLMSHSEPTESTD